MWGCFFFQAEDGIRDGRVTGVQTCALPISGRNGPSARIRLAVGESPEGFPTRVGRCGACRAGSRSSLRRGRRYEWDQVVRLTSTVSLNPDVALWTIRTSTRSMRTVCSPRQEDGSNGARGVEHARLAYP